MTLILLIVTPITFLQDSCGWGLSMSLPCFRWPCLHRNRLWHCKMDLSSTDISGHACVRRYQARWNFILSSTFFVQPFMAYSCTLCSCKYLLELVNVTAHDILSLDWNSFTISKQRFFIHLSPILMTPRPAMVYVLSEYNVAFLRSCVRISTIMINRISLNLKEQSHKKVCITWGTATFQHVMAEGPLNLPGSIW